MKMRCIAIDDEPLALAQIERYVKQTPFLVLEGLYSSALDALDALADAEIDLIFADINMPDLNGIELVKSLGPGVMVIFTTAYSEYAVEGFRVDAQDYLLKPIGYPDFLRAAEKALRQFTLLRNTTSPVVPPQERIFVRSEYKIIPVELDDITFIESRGEYVRIYTGNSKPVMTLGSLRNYEEKLPRGRFMRIHRSYIVNLSKIAAVERKQVIIGDKRIPVGESYEKDFSDYISHNS
ncbi:MAG: LytTR family DNA-binding domain-containing protein [Alistipes sp.]|nr:LytTR family DNA-binding domain-containing protein [Alistipes sp.]